MNRDDLIKAIKNRIIKIERHVGYKVIIDDWDQYIPKEIMDTIEKHSKIEFSAPEDMLISNITKAIYLIADLCRYITGYFVNGLGEVVRQNFDTPSPSIGDTRALLENYFNPEQFLDRKPFYDPNACVVYEFPEVDTIEYMVEEAGFEPTMTFAGGFTVRCLTTRPLFRKGI